jgi:formylglycine-generating enzyme required for sulfatase activity
MTAAVTNMIGRLHRRLWLSALAAPLALFATGCDSGGSSSAPGGGGGMSGGAGGGGGGATSAFQCKGSGAVGDLVAVPAGEFTMGCNTAVDNECADDELPMRVVNLDAFEIDRTEVSQDQYASCVNAGACAPPTCAWDCGAGSLPAGCITQDDAEYFCAWAGKRLPTEAEWEKAARGSDGRKFPWGNEAPDCSRVNMSGCTNERSPVGSLPAGASPYGALDMAGNMVEMVADYYDPSYYAVAPNANPLGPPSGSTYVGRGGGWKSLPYWHRTSVRDWYDPDDAGKSLGFRCAR